MKRDFLLFLCLLPLARSQLPPVGSLIAASEGDTTLLHRFSRRTMRRLHPIVMQSAVLLLLGALGVCSAFAQETPAYWVHPDYTVRQWTIRDGAPASSLLDIQQAHDGYLWVSSNEGVARFDGARFTVFNTANTPALPNNRIVGLAEGKAGQVWVRTWPDGLGFIEGGQYRLIDPEDGSVLYVEDDTVWIASPQGLSRYRAGHLEAYRPEMIETQASAMLRDRQGRLWVGLYYGGIYRFDPDGTGRHFDEDDGVPALEVFNFLEDREGAIWVGLAGGLVRILDDRVVTPRHPRGTWQHVRMVIEDTEGGVWFWHGGEGWWRHPPSGDLMLLPATHSEAERLKGGPDGLLWHADGGRLYRGDVLIFEAESDIESFTFDSQGNVWVGVARAGLFRLRRSALRTISTPEGLPHRNVYPVLEDRQGTIWVGTDGGGLARLDDQRVTQVVRPGEAIRALHEDRQGRLWVSTGSLCRVEGARCLAVATPVDSVFGFGILAMHEDRQGRFWLGGAQGILLGQPEGAAYTWTVFSGADDGPSSRVRAILETRDGALLFGTNQDGVLRYDENGGFEALTTAQGLASNNVRDLYEDHEGLLWIAHEDRGLCRVDRQGRLALADAAVACLSTGEGLYWHGLHRILEDDQGRFWFNTNNGIFWVERSALQAYFAGDVASVPSVSYTEADGMRNREGNGERKPAGIKARDGRLWFPTQDGVVIVDPNDVPLPTPPPVAIEAAQVEAEVRPVAAGLTLRASERDVTFQYTALEFNRPEDVHYQHYLEGYDQAWREAGSQRQATYTNLPPGRYVFHVRAGLGGRWGTAATVLVARAPYAWQTWWFLALCGLAVVAGGYGVYRFRLRQVEAHNRALEQKVARRTSQLRKKTKELEQVNEHKARFLANITHEFRTPLTLTFGPLEDALQGRFTSFEQARPHFERARRNGGRLLRLINQLLDLSKLDAGALLLHPRQQDLARHLRQLAALFDSIAETQGLRYSTRIPEHPVLHVYDADKIEKVVINLLSNAFKFTPRGRKVAVALTQEDEGGVRIVVADTGSGIAEEHLERLFDRFYQVEGSSTRTHEGSGIGLALVKELVELHAGTIAVESQVGFGTRFTVRLPQRDVEEETDAGVVEPEDAVPETAAPAEAERDFTISGSLRVAPVPAPEAAQVPDDATVVLVVEDNADMRAYIRAHLEASFTVVEAENGRIGLERAREVVPDLVLSDVMMPEMDGLEACAALKQDPATSHIPVVLLTARAEVEHRIAGFESGADAYLPKPFNAEELVVRVRTLVEARRRLQARFAGAALAGDDGRAERLEAAADEAEAVLPPREVAFLEQVEGVIESQMADTQFGAEMLAEALNLSPRQLRRKLRALLDETPVALIRRRRLAEAVRLLVEGALSVKQVGYAVGFSSDSSFSRAFRQVYGMSPSVYVEQL